MLTKVSAEEAPPVVVRFAEELFADAVADDARDADAPLVEANGTRVLLSSADDGCLEVLYKAAKVHGYH